jgi:hypothetical protein
VAKSNTFTGRTSDSVHLYIEAVQKNANEYLFLVRESMGGSPVLQRALRLQLFKLTNELAEDLARAPGLENAPFAYRNQVADAFMRIILSMTQEITEVTLGSKAYEALAERAILHLRMISSGAWHCLP